jgi:hypothetical protein
VNDELEAFCRSQGIFTSTTNGYSPEENGVVERANGPLLPRIRAMLAATRLPKDLWGEALLHSVHTLNRWTTSALPDGKTPYEALHDKKPDMSQLRTWGCLVQARINPEVRGRKAKLESRTDMCIMLGYSYNTVGVKLLSMRDGGVRTCRLENAFFHEQFTVAHDHVHRMLFDDARDDDERMNVPMVRIRTNMSSYVDEDNLDEHGLAGIELVLAEPHVEALSTSTPKRRPKRKRRSRKRADAAAADTDAEADPVQLTRPSMPPVTVLPRRKRARLSHLRDYVINAVLQGTSDAPIPQSYKQAKRSELWPEWKKVIESELSSLRDHETWRLIGLGNLVNAHRARDRLLQVSVLNKEFLVFRCGNDPSAGSPTET